MPLLEDCVDPETGELHPVTLVTDNGPCYKSSGFARFVARRHEIADGQALVKHVEDFRHEFNALRSHEALDWARPLDHYLEQPASYALSERKSVREG